MVCARLLMQGKLAPDAPFRDVAVASLAAAEHQKNIVGTAVLLHLTMYIQRHIPSRSVVFRGGHQLVILRAGPRRRPCTRATR
mmetsp:Transcript_67023/g.187386  ORF Transcript_67023/g.187386 Transcript_67023/m.187386 type:complete len:83 (+) Transcript_67023:1467-1715(+)